MRAVVQRVTRAEVRVDEQVVGRIAHGLCVLLGVKEGDGEAEVRYTADKIANLRIFRDEDGKMNRSLLDSGGGVLLVSQFTLYGDTRKGRRPSFVDAARPDVAAPLVDEVAAHLIGMGVQVETGRFGAMMDVELVNDGPVTLIVESP